MKWTRHTTNTAGSNIHIHFTILAQPKKTDVAWWIQDGCRKKSFTLDRHICLFLGTLTHSIDKPPYCCCQIDKTDEGCQPWRDWCLVLSHAEPKESNMLKEIRSWCIRKERMKNIIGKDGWMEEFTRRKKEHYR